ASSSTRSKIFTPPFADTVSVGPVAQIDVGTVKATSKKANVTASLIIVVGISEATLECTNGGAPRDYPRSTPKCNLRGRLRLQKRYQQSCHAVHGRPREQLPPASSSWPETRALQ